MSTTSLPEVARGQQMVRFITAELREGGPGPGPGHHNNNNNNSSSNSLDLVELLAAIQAAVKAVSATLRSSGLVKWRSSRETAGEIFTNYLRHSQAIALLVCDEKAIPVEIDGERRGKYVVCVSPLDTEEENPDPPPVAGSIFSVHRYLEGRVTSSPGAPGHGPTTLGAGNGGSSGGPAAAGRPSLRSVLQAGRNLVAAGYALYGSSTLMVLSLGHGAHLFVLDPVLGEFILTAPNLSVPLRGSTYSVDEGFTYEWGDPVVEYVESKKDPKLGPGITYRSHHVGSFVADVHNVLRTGGIYLSPQTRSNPNGKLRLVLEAAPLAHIVCRAGGLATDGQCSLTDCLPEGLRHRSAAFLGSKEDVRDLLAVFRRTSTTANLLGVRPSLAAGLRPSSSPERQIPRPASHSPSLASAIGQLQRTSAATRDHAEMSASMAALSATIVALGSRPRSSRPTSAVHSSNVSPGPQRPASAAASVAGSVSPIGTGAPGAALGGGGGGGAVTAGGGLPHSLPHSITQIPAKRVP